MDEIPLDFQTTKQLIKACKRRGLNPHGRREYLIKRLRKDLEQEVTKPRLQAQDVLNVVSERAEPNHGLDLEYLVFLHNGTEEWRTYSEVNHLPQFQDYEYRKLLTQGEEIRHREKPELLRRSTSSDDNFRISGDLKKADDNDAAKRCAQKERGVRFVTRPTYWRREAELSPYMPYSVESEFAGTDKEIEYHIPEGGMAHYLLQQGALADVFPGLQESNNKSIVIKEHQDDDSDNQSAGGVDLPDSPDVGLIKQAPFKFCLNPQIVQSLPVDDFVAVQITPRFTLYISKSPVIICRHSNGFSFYSDNGTTVDSIKQKKLGTNLKCKLIHWAIQKEMVPEIMDLLVDCRHDLLSEKRYKRLIGLLDEILENRALFMDQPEFILKIFYYKGEICELMRKYAKALRFYNSAAELALAHKRLSYHLADIWNAIGLVHARMEKFQAALSFYEKGLGSGCTPEQRKVLRQNISRCSGEVRSQNRMIALREERLRMREVPRRVVRDSASRSRYSQSPLPNRIRDKRKGSNPVSYRKGSNPISVSRSKLKIKRFPANRSLSLTRPHR